jgi:hypothetical protein
VDASAVARILSVDREWVYANARRLGAIRLNGPGSRLRFDVRTVDEVLGESAPTPRPTRAPRSRRSGTKNERAGVIDYER